ncbi:tetratricopeptide repeat protein [Lichenifustis flavocetrariae]|uniref:Tetratricopeptide repeat protein n=1 Tax=Lichenifustis flavocetrariae TaxID=2949735 RepID=A0AA41YYQ0_9HYPH|nr:hypothetical protein [Lichenifustis flavocetrariae]MCW6511031.1 hypothetical protein [Lichenifustis flavocetrariae]
MTAPLVAPPPKADDQAGKSVAPVSQADRLDDLFQRLAHAEDSEQASGIALLIQHLWLQSGSDTADLLMARAVVALGKNDSDLATKLLDKIVVIDPGWAEVWNKRATLRFLNGDDVGAMDDVAHVLVLEPRHFGALSGMSFILQRNGMKKEALALMRKAASIYPHNTELEKVKSQLELEVEGRDI